eukprot:7774950-Lingulodinium_polyedra.AAC.1
MGEMLDPGQQTLADSATTRLERRLCSSIDVDWDLATSSELLWLSTPAHIKGRLLPILERTGTGADTGRALHSYWRTQGVHGAEGLAEWMRRTVSDREDAGSLNDGTFWLRN